MNPSVAMFLSFMIVSVFSFISVAVWAGTRHQERKDFYRSETLKKLAESGGSAAVIEYLREEERLEELQRAEARARMFEGNRLGGLILIVVGATLMVAVYEVVHSLPIYLFGLIPLGIGVVLVLSSFMGGRPRAATR